MKLSFWDILASMVMLGGLALATIFINIFVNPYSFINPFPPPTPVASLQVPTLTPSQRSLPDLWTSTPETPGVPSVTKVYTTSTITVTGTHLVLPTGTSTSTRTASPSPSKSITNTPNRTLTSIALKTATKTATDSSSSDTTPPTTPGFPYCYDPTSDSTPTFTWTASTDSGGSGLKGYKITWGTDSGGNNTIYTSDTNSWTAPTITSTGLYYMFVRAVDNAGNESPWAGPNGFNYGGAAAPTVVTNAATGIGNSTAVLNGTVTANLSSTTVVFQYGLTAAYGTNVTLGTAVTGSIPTSVSTTISGLTPGTLYHFRAAAYNAIGGTYGGDMTFTTSSLPASTTTITGHVPNPSQVGDAITVTVAVTGSGTPTGTVTVSDGTVSCSPAITLAGGTGSCTLTPTTAGSKTLTATYSGDGSNAGSVGTIAHTVNPGNQTTLVAHVTPSSLTYGSTATLSTTGGSGTGAVTYSVGASTGCSVSGTTLSVTNASGTCDITATKAADANYLATTSASVNVPLSKANQATLTASSSPNPVTYGNTATLSSTGGSGTGAVTFSDGGSGGCSVAGTTLTVVDVSQTCQVTATKAADDNYNAATSAALTVTLQKANATITFGGAPSVTYGDPTFTVSATTTNTDSGVLTYSQVSGPCAWSAGSTFTVSGAGTCVVRAEGAATTNFNAASNTQNVTIAKASTTTTVDNGVPEPSASGAAYVVSVTVSSGAGTPTGTVSITFSGGGSCSATLSGGSGTCSITSSTVGPGTLTATYAGDTNFSGSSGTNSHTVS